MRRWRSSCVLKSVAATLCAAALLLGLRAGAAEPEATGRAPAAPAEASFKPFVFIHAGDPEIGKPDVKSTAERFALLARRANAIGAELVVVAGDLTHGSLPDEVKAVEEALKLFTMPVKVVPGNHDEPGMFAKHFGNDHHVFTHRNCEFIFLNSNRLLGDVRNDPQWGWLEQALGEARRRNRTHIFVVLHHPIADRSPLQELLSKHRVSAVLCGHLHTTQEEKCDGFTVYVAPGTARFRDTRGLGYRVFRVYADRVEQEAVPLEREVTRVEMKGPVR